MFIRKTVKQLNGRTYSTYLLVEAVRTPQGPWQKTICSLGDLSPGPPQKWLGLADRVEAALQGQSALEEPDPLEGIVARIRSAGPGLSAQRVDDVVAVHTDQVSLEKARGSARRVITRRMKPLGLLEPSYGQAKHTPRLLTARHRGSQKVPG